MDSLTPEIISFYGIVVVALIGAMASVIVAVVNKTNNTKPTKAEIPRGTVIEAEPDVDFVTHLRDRNKTLLAESAAWQKKYEDREAYWQREIEKKDRKITKLLVLLAKNGIDPPF